MALYDYKCARCGKVYEVRQKFEDARLTVHEGGCGGPVERLISAPALQFKGTGFYITDYAKGSGNSPASKKGDHGNSGDSSKGDSSKGGSSKGDSSSSKGDSSSSSSKGESSSSKGDSSSSSSSSSSDKK